MTTTRRVGKYKALVGCALLGTFLIVIAYVSMTSMPLGTPFFLNSRNSPEQPAPTAVLDATNSTDAPDDKRLSNVTASSVDVATKKNSTKQECTCDKDNYHAISLDEFKSTFARHNVSHLGFMNTKYIRDQYTIIIPSYKRDSAIPILLDHFCKAENVHKILIVWQNIGQQVPGNLLDRNCDVPYVFLRPEKNDLSNRFTLYDEIETEAIFTIDDDSYVKYEVLSLGFEVWKSYPHLMVGYVSRTHEVVKGRYHYHDTIQCYSLILTGVVFLHRRYLELYSQPKIQKLRDFVSQKLDGEDIVMNGIVSNYLTRSGTSLEPSCHGILVEGGRVELIVQGAGYVGLYALPGHNQKRDDLMEMIDEVFGGLPLTCCAYQIRSPFT